MDTAKRALIDLAKTIESKQEELAGIDLMDEAGREKLQVELTDLEFKLIDLYLPYIKAQSTWRYEKLMDYVETHEELPEYVADEILEWEEA